MLKMFPIVIALAAVPALAQETEDGKQRLLVLDLKTTGVDKDTAALVGELMGVTLSEQESLEVFSGADVKRLVELEADKASLGCEDDTSCLADVAGALGAKYVIYGRMGKLGSRFIVTLNLFDADSAKAINREDIKAPDLDTLSDELNSTVRRLISPLVGEQVNVTDTPPKVEDKTPGTAVPPPPVQPEASGSGAWLWFGSAAGVAVLALAIDGLSPTSRNNQFDPVDLIGPFGYITAIGLGVGGLMAGGS